MYEDYSAEDMTTFDSLRFPDGHPVDQSIDTAQRTAWGRFVDHLAYQSRGGSSGRRIA